MEKYRITFITDRLVRLEYQEEGKFCDEKTACVQNRDFGNVEYTVKKKGEFLEYNTEHLQILYDGKEFSPHGLCIKVKTNASLYTSIWYYGDKTETLGGTARTLDFTDGEVEVGDGLLSKNGFSILDDSNTALLVDGKIRPRKYISKDIYFFGYGRDYKACMDDFYKLSGKIPMLPRYALGNWWSRYYEYTQESYLKLMDKFKEKNIPLSVAVIDMDWHIVKVDPKYGSGWTGYTWNKDLFPNHVEFLKDLHDRGLRVTLNVHPANGVQEYEEPYENIRQAMGVESGEPVDFDCNDDKFMRAYFKYLHNPLEDEGVDFWWIDWQQGVHSSVEGLDPLLILNHEHYEDLKRKGERAIILSRYHGAGSHRYPVGFSGDTLISWKSLDLQPNFTARAANIGYTWWSHDIGGHYNGTYDEELFVRWVQFGVFSPINRLHSTKNEFNSKEPWVCNKYNEEIISNYLRLRHMLIPYLYTSMYNTSEHNEPICKPLYYEYPLYEESYEYQNTYYFGSQLIVAPITQKANNVLNAAGVKLWLPSGVYYDFNTGKEYKSGYHTVFRSIEEIPVFAKSGAIIPMCYDMDMNALPENMLIKVYPSSNNEYTMYEDDGKLKVAKKLFTKFAIDIENARFSIELSGDIDICPKHRKYTLEFVGFDDIRYGEELLHRKDNSQFITFDSHGIYEFDKLEKARENKAFDLFNALSKINIEYRMKEFIYDTYIKCGREEAILSITTKLDNADIIKYLLEYM